MNEQIRNADILIVEDTQESIDLLTYYLEPEGYRLRTAGDVQQARQQIAASFPDLVLLDALLPGTNGYELCRELKSSRRTFPIPIIMITALKELKDKIRALEAGADDFLHKPFDSVELIARVRSLLRLKLYHDELMETNRRLGEQKRRLEEADKLKKELTRMIIHDMQNPLSIIQGNAQMMNILKASGQPVEEELYTKRIERNSRGLYRMILNLLDISQLESDTLEMNVSPVNINKMIQESAAYFGDDPQVDTIACDLTLQENLPLARADGQILGRIVDNLLSYAYKNAPRMSTINITSSLLEGNRILVRMRHQGTPIPADFHEKVFTNDGQAEMKRAGRRVSRGLSLVFCRMALEAQQGTIGILGPDKEGVTIEFELPVWPARSNMSRPRQIDPN